MLSLLLLVLAVPPPPVPMPRALVQEVHLVLDGGVPVRNATDGGVLLNVYVAGAASTSPAYVNALIDGGFVTAQVLNPTGYVNVLVDGGHVTTTVINPVSYVNALIDGGSITVANFPATQAVTALGADGGSTFDITGSSLVIGAPVSVLPLTPNPFIPRCNPVRRTRCLP